MVGSTCIATRTFESVELRFINLCRSRIDSKLILSHATDFVSLFLSGVVDILRCLNIIHALTRTILNVWNMNARLHFLIRQTFFTSASNSQENEETR